MTKYRIVIRKVTEAEVVVEADSVAHARSMAHDQPSELFVLAESFDRDLFSVGKVVKAAG